MRVIRAMLSDIESITFDFGFVGEKNHTCVMINCVSLFNQYPDAVATMVASPPVGDIYPVVLHRDGVFVVWNISESDIANAGSGKYQLTFTDGEGDNAEIIKTTFGSFSVKPSMVSNGEPPDPIEDWLEEANEALAEFGKINELSASATTLESGQPATAEITTVDGHKNIAIGVPKGDKGDQGNPAPAEQVQPAVNAYLAQVITNPDSPPLDRTLSSNVSAAPADMVGDLKSAIKQIADDVFSTEFVHLADNKMASGSIRGIDYSVIGNTVKINGTATGAVRLKVSGNSFVEGTSVDQSWLSESIGLVTGHKYVACAELVSGSLGTTRFVIYGSESTSAVYQLDFTSSNAQKGKVVYGSEFTASATNSSAFIIYMASGWAASNACIKFDLLDLTAAEDFIFEKIGHDYHIPEQIIQMSRNALFPLGYKDIITENGKMDDYNGITAEVYGNRVKLNGTCTSAIRLKLTNDIEYAHSVDSNWYNETIGVPNNGHTFIVAVSCLSGTGSGEDMQVVFYNSSGGQHPTRLMKPTSTNYSLGMKYSEEFTDLSELNFLCIYIKTGVTLNNVELQIGLYDIAELAKILDFADGDIIPQYYFTNNYLQNKITDIENIGVSLSVNSLRFVFNTDYHMAKNANISPALIKKIAEDTGIKTVIFNGDYMVSETTPLAGYSDICDFVSLVAPLYEVADVHFVTGNHEWNDPSASYSDRRIGRGALVQLLNAYDADITMLDPSVSNAFYIDFGIPKIRCYCIDMEYNAYISMDTRTKMFESLLSVPEGYAVLVCSHGAMKDATNAEITGRFGHIMECCAAMNDGVPVTLNDVTYDFTNKARTFIGALTGHTHVDGYLIYDDRFPVIVTECDAWNAQASGGTRTSGTVDEQAFEVVQIDVTARRIYLTRIGHGNDRTFSFGVSGAGLIT